MPLLPHTDQHHQPPAEVVRLVCIGERSWNLVQKVASTATGLLVPAQPKPEENAPVEVIEPDEQPEENAPVEVIEPDERLHIEPDTHEGNTHYYLPSEHISMADRKDSLRALFADEDAIWHEPSKHTISVLRRLLGG